MHGVTTHVEVPAIAANDDQIGGVAVGTEGIVFGSFEPNHRVDEFPTHHTHLNFGPAPSLHRNFPQNHHR